MAIHKLPLLLFLSIILLSFNLSVFGDIDEEDILFTGINNYRTSQNLTTLYKNKKAECLAEEIADQFENKPCINNIGSATTKPQFTNYPHLLAKCNMNMRDGAILPACVPRLESNLILTNFIKTQYSMSLNDSKFTSIGIGKEDDWIVVVLITNTSPQRSNPNTPQGSNPNTTQGSYSTATTVDSKAYSNGYTFSIGVFNYLIVLMFSFYCFFNY